MQKEYTEEQAIKEAIEYNSVHTKGETDGAYGNAQQTRG